MSGPIVELHVHRGNEHLRTIRLVGTRMIMGRSPDVDIVLDSDTASRRHAELVRDDRGRWWVRDLGSVNGTIVNGGEVKNHALRHGDVITIANFALHYRELAAQSFQQPPPRPSLRHTRVTFADSQGGVVKALRELETPKIDASHLSHLIAFSGSLLAIESEQTRLQALCELMIGEKFHGMSAVVLRLRRGACAAPSEPEPAGEAEVLCGPVPAAADSPYISRSVLRAVAKDESPVLASNAPSPGSGRVEMSMVVNKLSAVVCPIGRTAVTLDVLYVTLPVRFGTAEWLALASLAAQLFEQAQAAWTARELAQQQARLKEELERASAIQTSLVPADFEVGGLDIGFGFEPSKWVGGDYVDAVATRDGKVFLTVMDVCGKGLQAALIATGLHTTVHILSRQGLALAEIVSTLADQLVDTLQGESFVTLCAVVYDPDTGDLELVNCGAHPPPFIASPDGVVREAQASELVPLGFMPIEVTVARDRLEVGEMLAIYSDGLSELEDPSETQLGADGVAGMLGEIFYKPPPRPRTSGTVPEQLRTATGMAAALRARLAAYRQGAPAGDDTSFVLAIRRE